MRKSILIAESGSSKTDWVFISNSGEQRTSSIGLNPFVVDSTHVLETLKKDTFFSKIKNDSFELVFYGSGCSSKKRNEVIYNGLHSFFPNAKIEILHDIQAAVNATCNNKPGIVGILGTGSNCVYFDGKKVDTGHPSPGYLIGDEGAGMYIGKTFLRDVLYKIAPSDILSAFEAEYNLSSSELIEEIYAAEHPNAYIASYVKFLGKHAEHHYTEELVHRCFAKFVKFHVVQFPEAAQAPLHLIGSIAFHFENIIDDVLEEWKIEKGVILKSPLRGLIEFHKK